MFRWRTFILFILIILLPSIIIGISNWYVFPDSFWLATLMLVVTVGVAGVFSYFAGDAMPKVSQYCVFLAVVLAVVLCTNLAGHWLLAREVAAAKQGVTERHEEEDRQLEREKVKTDLEIARNKSATDLARAESRRLAQLPLEERRSTPRAAPKPPAPAPSPTATPEMKAAKLTPDQVREKWQPFLTAMAIAEVIVSVLAGAVLAGIWEWDRNHDGIADHKQQPQSEPQGRATTVPPRATPGFVQAQTSRNDSPKARSDQE